MIGSLKTLKSRLAANNIYDFKSVKDVLDFQASYNNQRQQIISDHEKIIEEEKNMLSAELQQLTTEIEGQKRITEQILTSEIDNLEEHLTSLINSPPKTFFHRLRKNLKIKYHKKIIQQKENHLEDKVNKSVDNLSNVHQSKTDRYEYIDLRFSDAVRESSKRVVLEIDRKKSVVDSLNSYIYGAFGEQKVVKTLETLSDEYYLINDFTLTFYPAIYYRQEQEYIQSIQIDHLLVGSSGIFLIETKNWSEKSLENLSLRSPVQQIRRASFVLFKMLNNEMSNFQLQLNQHHWGDKKVSIKNLIVLTNTKPMEEFQYVKILTLNELLGYVNYFKPTFSSTETKRIADFLLSINENKPISTR